MAAISVEPCTFALFGALGDLALRKLFPALYQLDRAGLLHADSRLLALAREAGDSQQHLANIEAHLRRFVPDADIEAATLGRFLARLSYLHLDFLQPEGYQTLAEQAAPGVPLIAYFATPAAVYGAICENLDNAGLVERTRVVLEKPIGHDLESSRRVNDAVARFFPESRVYRIDHYLGKETVQNLIALRFANSLFETQWNQNSISHVEITVAEKVGIEGRWGYFDKAGQLRDMIQNHLLQLLCLIAMDPPSDLSADSIRDEKVKVLKALAPITGEALSTAVVRGQYIAGYSDGKPVPGYLEEDNANAQSDTETFVALRADIRNWRWSGVPFYLRTGKRMSVRDTEIVICFKPAPYAQFRDTEVDELKPTYLKIQIQPNEGMWFDLLAKKPGPTLDMANIQLGFAYKDFFEMQPSTGYETLIYDCMTGDQTLFQRADNIENGWRAVQPFLDAWKEDDGIQTYKAGEDGPAAADALLARDGRTWHSLG